MNLVTLSHSFYSAHSQHTEILKKINRPYFMMLLTVESKTFAIPFRSHIRHPYVYWTDKENLCGLDFTKAVLIRSIDDIQNQNVQIRQNEFNAIKGKEHHIVKRFSTFLRTYKKAYHNQTIPRNKLLIQNSALQYFINDLL